MVSSYYQQLRTMPKDDYLDIKFRNMSFSEYVHHLLDSKKSDNFITSFYGDNNFVETQISEGKTWGGLRLFDNQADWNDLDENVNYFKLEDVTIDFSPVSNLIGVDVPQLNLINVNPTEVDYDELLTDDLKIIIRELFHKDFETFSY